MKDINNILGVDQVKSKWVGPFLTEGSINESKISAADWEFVLVHAHNVVTGSSKESIESITGGKIKESDYKAVKKNAEAIAKEIIKKTGASGVMVKLPNAGIKTSGWWTGTDNTPKTDIFAGKAKISLKAVGGSQLMSASGAETASTFKAAMKLLDINSKKGKDLVKYIESNMVNFEAPENYTIGDVTDTVNQYRKLQKAGDTKGAEKLLAKVGDELGEAVMGYLEADSTKKAIADKTSEWLEQDQTFREWFVFEAATGLMKFEPSPDAAANYIVVFNPNNSKVDIHEISSRGGKPTSYIKTLAKKVSFRVSWKTHSSKSKHSKLSFRADVKESITREVSAQLKYLSENELNEWEVFTKIKNWLKNIWGHVWGYLKEIAARGVEALMGFIGLEPDTVDVSGLPTF